MRFLLNVVYAPRLSDNEGLNKSLVLLYGVCHLVGCGAQYVVRVMLISMVSITC